MYNIKNSLSRTKANVLYSIAIRFRAISIFSLLTIILMYLLISLMSRSNSKWPWMKACKYGSSIKILFLDWELLYLYDSEPQITLFWNFLSVSFVQIWTFCLFWLFKLGLFISSWLQLYGSGKFIFWRMKKSRPSPSRNI